MYEIHYFHIKTLVAIRFLIVTYNSPVVSKRILIVSLQPFYTSLESTSTITA